MDQKTMVHLHDGILCSRRKGAPTLCDSMDGPGEHYAKWYKPGSDFIWTCNWIHHYLYTLIYYFKICCIRPWLVWLNGLSGSLWTKGSPVRFPVRAMPGMWARAPVGGSQEASTHWCSSPSLSRSFPLSLKINKILRNIAVLISYKVTLS